MNFSDIYNKTDIDFYDRKDIIEIVHTEYMSLRNDQDYFKILSLYGMGGIGKSRLLTEFKAEIKRLGKDDPNLKMIELNLEISKSDNLLNSLAKIRGEIHEPCPLFDYALLIYWSRIQITKLDDEFMSNMKAHWFDAVKTSSEFISFGIKNLSEFFCLPLNVFVDIVSGIYKKVRLKYYSSYFKKQIKDITLFSTDELSQCLGVFLGIEINRIYCQKHLVMLIDSYEQYDETDFTDWFIELAKYSFTGLFIVSSREKLKYSNDFAREHIKEKRLGTLPEVETKKLLKQYLSIADEILIRHLVRVTDCIPIYLELAINTFTGLLKTDPSFSDKTVFMYKDKHDVIKKFFLHLKEGEQEFMLALSIVQIFDEAVFQCLINAFPIVSIFSYERIKTLTLVSHIENDSNFYKIHDVITANVIQILPKATRYRIFRIYLNHIHTNSFFLLTEVQQITLYKHLLCMVIANQFTLNEKDIESLLDLFFLIKQTMQKVSFSSVKNFENYEPLKDMYILTMAVYNERKDTKIRLQWLENIDEEHNLLGKHNKSLKIIKGYLKEWLGDKTYLVETLATIDKQLAATEILEWYYAQTKLFLGDYLTITGAFCSSESVLSNFYEDIKRHPILANSQFQATRHLGHLYRFNMLLAEANSIYLSTRDGNGKFVNTIQEIYIVTNLCEVNCYLNPEVVWKYCFEGLILAKSLKDLKSQAKIYYSMAIAQLLRKNYKRAYKYIKKSLYCNRRDGYRLGQLFPLLVKIYAQYATDVPLKTADFCMLLEEVGVYGFLLLPLAILKKDHKMIASIKMEYEWIDFTSTVNSYQSFFDRLRP